MRELGFDRSVYSSWFAIFAPVGVPADRIARLAEAFRQVVTGPDMRASLPTVGMNAAYRSPTDLGAFAVSEGEKCRALVTLAGVEPQ